MRYNRHYCALSWIYEILSTICIKTTSEVELSLCFHLLCPFLSIPSIVDVLCPFVFGKNNNGNNDELLFHLSLKFGICLRAWCNSSWSWCCCCVVSNSKNWCY